MAKFEIGQLVAPRGVHDLMQENPGFNAFAQSAFLKYRRCDWGDTCESDKAQNDSAVANGDDRILVATSPLAESVYYPCGSYLYVWTMMYVENLGATVGTVGHFYNIMEWISDEEADRIKREEGI